MYKVIDFIIALVFVIVTYLPAFRYIFTDKNREATPSQYPSHLSGKPIFGVNTIIDVDPDSVLFPVT